MIPLEKGCFSTWKQWRKRYISSLELNMTSEQLITNKEISRLAKVFASWQRITPLLRRSGYQRQMAGTKYNRKLAKRAVTALISYGAYAKHKNNVYSTALNRAKMLVKRNCLLALQIYADFRKKQSGKDAVLIPRLKTMIKGLRFKAWYSHALLFSSCRYLPELLSGLQKRQFLKRLRVVTDMQKLSDAYMQLHQEHALKTQVLQAWSQYVKKKADLVDKERTFRVRNRFYLKLVPYRIWRRAYVVERNIWTLYGLAVIRIKNDILKVCLRGWKLYRGYRLRKLYSRTHRDLVLKKQSLYAWEHLIKKSARLTHLREVAQTQIQQKIVRQVFYTWIMNAIKKEIGLEPFFR